MEFSRHSNAFLIRRETIDIKIYAWVFVYLDYRKRPTLYRLITYELINAQFNNYLNTKLDDITEVEYYRTVFQ